MGSLNSQYRCRFVVIGSPAALWPIEVRELADNRGKASELATGIPAARLPVAIFSVPVMGLTTALAGHSGDSARLVWLFALALLAAPWNQQWLMQELEMMGRAAVGQFLRTLAFTLVGGLGFLATATHRRVRSVRWR